MTSDQPLELLRVDLNKREALLLSWALSWVVAEISGNKKLVRVAKAAVGIHLAQLEEEGYRALINKLVIPKAFAGTRETTEKDIEEAVANLDMIELIELIDALEAYSKPDCEARGRHCQCNNDICCNCGKSKLSNPLG